MKVLIVDGSKESRRETVDALSELTNVVILGAVSNVRTALYAVADAPPDVVVTDTVLPDGDSAQLVERMRRLERTPSIVVVTGAHTDEERDRYLAAGVDRYVERDAELRGLQDAVIAVGRTKPTIAPADTMRLLGRLASAVVHDVNNYLLIVEGAMSLIERHPGDRDMWNRARFALDAIRELTQTLLVYARGAAPEPITLDLGEVVRDVIAMSERLIPAGVRVELDVAPGLRSVRAVRPEIQQLVLNLVINACDAMGDGGVLHVAVTRTASAAVRLRVADSGIGMQCERPRRDAGAGLGLTIARAVVDRHRGALQFAARPGGGTIVDVILPSA